MDIIFETNYLIIATSVGLGLFFSTYFLIILKTIKENKFTFSFKIINNALNKNRYLRNIKRAINKFIRDILALTVREKYLVLAIILLVLSISGSVKALPRSLFWGLVIGLFIINFSKRMKRNIIRTKKLKEVVVLFEGIEIYSKAGYSLVQSLRASKLLVSYIVPSIDKCLNSWSLGPQKALEILKKDLDLEEIDSLILLMMHLESAGAKNFQGMLQREAHNIDRLQKMKVEIKIAHRPLILLVYKILPIMAILGIIVGSLLYRMFYILNGMGIFK